MRKFILKYIYILLSVFVTEVVFAQQSRWTVEKLDYGIMKVIYSPPDYPNNENISDAVILKPKGHYNNVTINEDQTLILKWAYSERALVMTGVNSHNRYGFSLDLTDGERIYGGGSRAIPMNRRGWAFDLDNRPWYGYSEGADNLNFSVPFFISSDGYGILFDNPSRGHTDIGKSHPTQWKTFFSSGELAAYIIPGTNVAEILKKYHLLTGFQGLPPRWVLGNFMSRFGYTSENQVKDISQMMRDARIPFDAIIFDLFWFGDSIKGTMGNLDWVSRKNWPYPEKMISELTKDDVKSILITEPFILKSSTNYDNSRHLHGTDANGDPYIIRDFYFGEAGLIDIFREDARHWFWLKHDAQNKIGVAAWWGDLGEPEKHPADMYHNLSDLGYHRLFSSDEVHNIFGHYWTKMLYENYEKSYPDTRLFSLNRSGFAGSQRYSIFPWSGDVHRSWSGLRAQLPVMLGMSLSGIPYMHSDAGGFAMGEGDYELYLRWLQMSVFTPILRPHGSALEGMDKSSFSFPSEPALMPEPWKSLAREAILLRYKLLPYNYNLSYLHTTAGRPMAAPLFYDYPQDPLTVSQEKSYLWGPNILVAPVLEKGITEQAIVLPKGKWYYSDLAKRQYLGSYTSEAKVKINMHQIPTFVKEGSFIPMCVQEGQTSKDYTTDSLWVQYYTSSEPSSYTLFDDDGHSKNSIRRNEYELITFSARPGKKSHVIMIRSNEGIYPTQPDKRHLILQILGDITFKHATIKSNRYRNKIILDKEQTLRLSLGKSPIRIILKT